jgi:hypothetical protein
MARTKHRRRFHTERVTRNRVAWIKRHGWIHLDDRAAGRWAKRHPGDCGRARCGLCHGDKLYGPKARGAAKRAAILDQLA